MVFMKLLGLGSKSSLGMIKLRKVGTSDSRMYWVKLLTSTIQFLFISRPETLLHMTVKRRAEISADISTVFPHRLQHYCIPPTPSYRLSTVLQLD